MKEISELNICIGKVFMYVHVYSNTCCVYKRKTIQIQYFTQFLKVVVFLLEIRGRFSDQLFLIIFSFFFHKFNILGRKLQVSFHNAVWESLKFPNCCQILGISVAFFMKSIGCLRFRFGLHFTHQKCNFQFFSQVARKYIPKVIF